MTSCLLGFSTFRTSPIWFWRSGIIITSACQILPRSGPLTDFCNTLFYFIIGIFFFSVLTLPEGSGTCSKQYFHAGYGSLVIACCSGKYYLHCSLIGLQTTTLVIMIEYCVITLCNRQCSIGYSPSLSIL